jgi:hypothetical protein
MTGVRISVVTHVSAIVWPAAAREALAVPGQAPHGRLTHRPPLTSS